MKNKQKTSSKFFQENISANIYLDSTYDNEKNINTLKKFNNFNKKESNNKSIKKINDFSNKHFPSPTKEWSNSIYTYNKKHMRNIALKYQIVTKTIRNFINGIPIALSKRVSQRTRINQIIKIYMSKPEIKHNSSTVVITLYIYAPKYFNITYLSKYLNKENFAFWMYRKTKLLKIKDFISKEWKSEKNQSRSNQKRLIIGLYKYKNILIEILNSERKIQKMKKYFENRISKFYNKKVIINLVRLKYLFLSSNMVAEYLALKLKRDSLHYSKTDIWNQRTVIYNKVPLLKQTIKNKYYCKFVSLLNNISKIPLNMVNNKPFNKKIKNPKLLTNNFYKEILNLIKYKYPVGIRVACAGRLTKRYRADRAVYKWYYKGIFNSIDSSINRQSVVLLRSCVRPNVVYSRFTLKRRIGAYSVKSWLSFF